MKPSLIYIGGYGRSGSTLLDTLLSGLPNAWSGGELCWLFSEIVAGRRCSCGALLTECSFWTEVLERVRRSESWLGEVGAARLTEQMQRWDSLMGPKRRQYASLWRDTLSAIRDVSGAAIIVDSSKSTRKSTWRPDLLSSAGEAVGLLHLVRDPRQVMASVRKGSNRRLERGGKPRLLGGEYRAMVSWVLTNALFEWRSSSSGRRVLLVRYEDLVADPLSELGRIADFFELEWGSLRTQVESDEPFDPGHAIAGNRMRRQGQVRIEGVGAIESQNLPSFGLWIPQAAKLMRRYGYDDQN